MKYSVARSGFSLVEVTLALGIAALCLIALMGTLPVAIKVQQASVQQTKANAIISEVLGNLRAAVRLPPGLANQLDNQDSQQNQIKTLNNHWLQVGTPDTIWFSNDGKYISINGSVPADAAFRVKITYILPPTEATSVAEITVSWPAQVDPATGTPAGSVETYIAINRS